MPRKLQSRRQQASSAPAQQNAPATAQQPELLKAAVLSILEDCEGYDVFYPSWVTAHGLPEEFAKSLTRVMGSDGTHKGTIFGQDGRIVEQVEAIHDLELVRAICGRLGVSTDTPYFGRGSECRELVRRIRAHYEAQDEISAMEQESAATLAASGITVGEEG